MFLPIDGKKVSEKILNEVKEEISYLEYKPKLVVISVGEDQASKVYIKNKKKACEFTGIDFEEIHMSTSKNLFDELMKLVNKLNVDDTIDGILIQKPIPDLTKKQEELLFLSIHPEKDVDGFGPVSSLNLYSNTEKILPCTPKGVITLLEEYKIGIEGKHIVIIGRSNIVGKPLALALLNRNATVTICHSKTKDLYNILKTANIIISAVGIPKFITATMPPNDIEAIIDVGINRDENGKLCGDVDYFNIIDRFNFQEDELDDHQKHYITPVPGGVGPMTVASLMQNILQLSKNRYRFNKNK